ncbi:MAG: hypothetical protein Q4A78_00450 [Peptostreptococcaceae bacterium]|nr:hypothetical protein [Peptostreptococcaceae bacterium]
MKNEERIFFLLNQIEEGEVLPLPMSDEEKEELFQRFQRNLQKKQNSRKSSTKRTGLSLRMAACLLLLILATQTPAGAKVYAGVKKGLDEIRWGIGQALGKSGDYAPYVKTVDQEREIAGLKIRLHEALIDENKLFLEHLLHLPADWSETQRPIPVLKSLRIDGKTPIQPAASSDAGAEEELSIVGEQGRMRRIDGEERIYSYVYVYEFSRPISEKGSIDISYEIASLYFFDEKGEKRELSEEETPQKKFAFRAGEGELAAKTRTIRSGLRFTDEKKREYLLESLRINPFSQKLILLRLPSEERKDEREEDVQWLTGQDQRGRKIFFERRESNLREDGSLEMSFYLNEEADLPLEGMQESSGNLQKIGAEQFCREVFQFRFRLYRQEKGRLLPISEEEELHIPRR